MIGDMKKMYVTFMIVLFGLSSNIYAQKALKVKVFQDTFVQGGETSDEALGSSKSGRMRVMKSSGNDKYSRTAYLQFNLKKVKAFETVSLNICVRTYPNKKDSSAKFTLNVYSCEDNKWNESTLTFNSKPEKGMLIATKVLEVNDDNVWTEICLPADKVKELLKNSKKGKISLVLANDDFNRTSIEVITK